MTVRIVSGANEDHFPIAGRTVGAVRKTLRDAFNIAPEAEACIKGKTCGDDTVLQDGDSVEFSKTFGQKGGIQEFWTATEVMELFGDNAINELKEFGFEPYHEPVYTKAQLELWQIKRVSKDEVFRSDQTLIVDFQTMKLRHKKQGDFEINTDIKFRLLARLARSPHQYIHFDLLKDDVWEGDDVQNDTIRRESRRLNEALVGLGVQGVRIDIKGTLMSLIVD